MDILKKTKVCVFFHQGWTDIIMCLPLINYYLSKYNEVTVLIRSDAKELINFYINGLVGVNVIYINTDNGRFHGNVLQSNHTLITYENNILLIPYDYDIMFHAEFDKFRNDRYKFRWYSPHPQNMHFSEMFYVLYGIDFKERINSFSLKRDFILEKIQYNEFIKTNGTEYILYHDDIENNKHGPYHVPTKIDFDKIESNYTYVNLNKSSQLFFDYIKIIQNAKEIHLIDSVWGCLLYQLDAKYNILNGKEVNLYCKRGHHGLFLKPITLDNWKIIN